MSIQEQFNRSTSEIYRKISKHVPEIEWKVHAPLIEKINKLKNLKIFINLIFLAPEIFIGSHKIEFEFSQLLSTSFNKCPSIF